MRTGRQAGGAAVQGAAPASTVKEVVFHVSPRGNDEWSGRRAEPAEDGRDGPFSSLEKARDAVRALHRDATRGYGRVRVDVHGGEFLVKSSFVLDERDSGAPDAPVTWAAGHGERPRLIGGVPVSGFQRVTDPAILRRLDPAARGHVLVADLHAVGITDFGALRSRGYNRPIEAAHLELFFDGEPMTLAQWPERGFTTIAGIPGDGAMSDERGGTIGALDKGFFYSGDRPKRWQDTRNVWVHGYWAWDWANSYEQVASIDTENRLVRTLPPYGHFGFRAGNRFYFLNILEELDSPAEYYVDQAAGLLYFWPPRDIEGLEILASVLEDPVIMVRGAHDLSLEGLSVDTCRGRGIMVHGGHGVRIAGCVVRNCGADAVAVEGGQEHEVLSCDISDAGDAGIRISGGERATLTACGHSVVNNHITRIGRWSRTYCPGIDARGVGITIAHNLIHHVPHIAILYLGNEILVEYNHLHHVTMETGDAGATYTGRDYTARGITIRHNYVHDTGGVGVGTMGVYLDDCASGTTIFGNIFVRVQRAVFLGGGRDITVENNLFVDCWPSLEIDARGLDRSPSWHAMVYDTMKPLLDAVDYHHPPWCDRYPEMLALDTYYAREDGVPPENNLIARNICASGRWLYSGAYAKGEPFYRFVDNLLTDSSPFWNAGQGDYHLKPGSAAFQLGFRRIPLEDIGLVRDEFRTKLPGTQAP